MIKVVNRKRRIARNPVSISLFNKGQAGKIFEEVRTEGVKPVLKNNKVVAVVVSPSVYNEMVEKAEDYELLVEANRRMKSSKKRVSMKEAMKILGVTQEELDKAKVEIEL